MISIGTKSVLFGVHQFLIHPLMVARAWRALYGRWPSIYQWVAIFCHDVGYWNASDMDGDSGWRHPEAGARIARGLVFLITRRHTYAHWSYLECLGHSKTYSQRTGVPLSKLYAADKASILFEPAWFYLLRARLSGELAEYMSHGPMDLSPEQWLRWLRTKFKNEFGL